MIVKNIDFSVNQQTIKFSTAAQLVANSAGIATASFSFSTDWSDYDTIKVIFSNGDTKKAVIIADGLYTVTIPSECMIAGRLVISAVGLTGAEGEETFKRATTELNRGVEVITSGATEGDPADLPTPTEAEQIALIAANANTTAQQANATANTANETANTADAKAQEALDKFPYVVMGETTYGGTITTNLNTIAKNGFYTCYGTATGAPSTASSWMVMHQNSNAGTLYAHQRAVAYTEDLGVMERVKYNGIWQPWISVLPDTRFKGLRLAKQIILTEAAATIEINTDSDGNPLNSELGGELLVYSGTNTSITSSTGCNLQINNETSAVYWNNSFSAGTIIYLGWLGAQYTSIRSNIDILDNNIFASSLYMYRYDTGGSKSNYGGGLIPEHSAVTSLKLLTAGGTFPAGTVVEWWERG